MSWRVKNCLVKCGNQRNTGLSVSPEREIHAGNFLHFTGFGFCLIAVSAKVKAPWASEHLTSVDIGLLAPPNERT